MKTECSHCAIRNEADCFLSQIGRKYLQNISDKRLVSVKLNKENNLCHAEPAESKVSYVHCSSCAGNGVTLDLSSTARRACGGYASCRHPAWQKSSVVLQAGSPSSASCCSPPFQDPGKSPTLVFESAYVCFLSFLRAWKRHCVSTFWYLRAQFPDLKIISLSILLAESST